MSNKRVVAVINKYIAGKLNTPVARRSRKLAALSAANGVLKVRWDKPTKTK